MSFNKNTDQIAITIPEFRMKRTSEGEINIFNRKHELHIATIAIDQDGQADSKPAIYINEHTLEYGIRPWERVKFMGDGRMIYGPANPGAFVYCIVVFIESDAEVRNFGKELEEFVKKEEFTTIVATLATLASPSSQAIISILAPLTQLVSSALRKNKNDIIFTQEGVFLRDKNPPYNIGDTFISENRHIQCAIKVIPLLQDPAPSKAASESFIVDKASKNMQLEKLAGMPQQVVINYSGLS